MGLGTQRHKSDKYIRENGKIIEIEQTVGGAVQRARR
jgi:hypothetical protein